MFFLFFFFAINDLYFLFSAVILQIFNPILELAMSTGTPNNVGKSEIITYPVTTETKKRKYSK